MFKSALNWGYERFKQSDLSRSPLAIRVARRARDAIFTVMVWKDGDAGERIVETDVLDHQLYVDLEDSGVREPCISTASTNRNSRGRVRPSPSRG